MAEAAQHAQKWSVVIITSKMDMHEDGIICSESGLSDVSSSFVSAFSSSSAAFSSSAPQSHQDIHGHAGFAREFGITFYTMKFFMNVRINGGSSPRVKN